MSHASKKIHLLNEILAMIIKELASDSKDNNKTLVALASCRPTCHVLSSLAMPFIFSSIQLTDDLGNSAILENRLAACRILKKKRAKKIESDPDS